jgi:pyridoxamine 5'-phosphate oxidase
MSEDPLRRFESWFREAHEAGVDVPEAMVLATATSEGRPSARFVLLKDADERGFAFYTGYGSRKADELAENPCAALVFYWRPLGKQVRVEGTVERVPEDESAAYFATRPRGSQLAAWASAQSRPLASREELERRYAELEREHDGRDVPLPPHWGGYRLTPDAYEFWVHHDNRLHERERFTREDGDWKVELLGP